jgi:hypothetical protein
MSLRPLWISVWICGWRENHLVDLIEIECMDSLTLRLRIYERPVVLQLLDARNQF